MTGLLHKKQNMQKRQCCITALDLTGQMPIEYYILIIFPIIIFIIGLYYSPGAILGVKNIFFSGSTAHFLFFGAGFFELSFFFLYVYLIVKVAARFKIFLEEHYLDKKQKKYSTSIQRKKLIKSTLFLSTIFIVPTVSMLAGLIQISVVDARQVATSSNFLMHLDRTLFGVYVPFWLQQLSGNRVVDFLLYWSYMSLATVTSIIFIAAFLKDINLLRKLVVSFFLVVMIALPSWYIFPAVTPFEMYRNKVVTSNIPPTFVKTIDPYLKMTSVRVAALDDGIIGSAMGSHPEDGHFHVSTFPSMHIAWGTLALYFSFLISVPLGVLLTPWFFFNTLGSLYTLEHYGVDVIAGFLVAVTAIIITNYFFSKTKKYNEYPEFFYALEFLQSDIVRLAKRAKTAFVVFAKKTLRSCK